MRTSLLLLAIFFLSPVPARAEADPAQVLDFRMRRLAGPEQDLAEYRGDVVLMVNVASPVRADAAVHGPPGALRDVSRARLRRAGAFRRTTFAGRSRARTPRSGSSAARTTASASRCSRRSGVRGEGKHPLYARLTAQPEPVGGEVAWNFQKYLVDRRGRVVARFEPRTEPRGSRADRTARVAARRGATRGRAVGRPRSVRSRRCSAGSGPAG